MKKLILLVFLFPQFLFAQIMVVSHPQQLDKYFPLKGEDTPASILIDKSDAALIRIASGLLADDIKRITGERPKIAHTGDLPVGQVVVIGTIGKSELINELVKAKKLDIDPIRGDWERFLIQTVSNPFPGVTEALVIAGSDRRGTAYGVFTISEAIGVSPWHYWADVPAQPSKELYISKETYISKTPSVKYRGIFINDEAPALRGWAAETFGGFNHDFYEKVFELILRNKGNYLWPAMWRPSAFFDDDPENRRTADDWGIIISTSHHEPMMRAHDEWSRFGEGPWNYGTNRENLRQFWRGGIERMGDMEGVVTVGMRGDGDEAMSDETAVELLQTIIADQREIIGEVTGKPAEETPQVWAIYKEVQDYYDKGMRVDDDILVLLCDDNWGNVRILPKKEDPGHEGGYGMYYHFDFVGGPVSYRWLNVTQIERVWEQMNMAYQWGVDDLWIVNVGDIKPMELPISFFLDFAWDTDAIRADDLPDYYVRWARQQFGDAHAEEIGEILALYTKYNARRTPEMLTPETYSLTNYREANRVVKEYADLLDRSWKINYRLPEGYRSAFYQLVLSPVAFCSNLNEMYVAAGKNKLYADQLRASANYYADKVKACFEKDAALTRYFHDTLAGGKWDPMMAQTHIGYTSWNNPPVNRMPEVTRIQIPQQAGLGYVVEHGTRERWGWHSGFPEFDPVNDQSHYLEVYNRGKEKLTYQVEAREDWIRLSKTGGTVIFEEKVYVSIDWEKAPGQPATGKVILRGAGQEFTLNVPIRPDFTFASGFVENNGVISIEAAHFTEKHDTERINWTIIQNMGRTNSAVTVMPSNADRQIPGEGAPYLEYAFTNFSGGELTVDAYLSPTLNYQKNDGLLYAIAIDDEEPQVINMHEGEAIPDWEYPEWWNNSVTDHIKKKRSTHANVEPGTHVLKVWMVDPGVVFQKFVIDAGGLKPSYLGPPESRYVNPGK